jgi:threonylcarbamoyladenosine tRNA methylthiotransferase MtaB
MTANRQQVSLADLQRADGTDHAPHGLSFATTTLGCKVNLYESGVIARSLQQHDWQQVDSTAAADLYVINTCTVTAEADRQARQLVRRLVRQNPQALIVVTGCYAQIDPAACAAIPGVDLVLGNDRKLDLYRLLPALQRGELPEVLVGNPDQHVSLPAHIIDSCEGHTRAFVQVQQGCDQGCTFCVIHTARGPSRSFPPTLVRRQVQRLLMNGYREIVLCGVDIGSYGKDLQSGRADSYSLATLLRDIAALDGDFRLRVSSIDPAYLDEQLIDVLAGEEKVCPHFHLSLQSGNTLTLKRMKRRYTAEQMYQRVMSLKAAMPGVVFGADILCGFPTESDQAHADSVAMIHDLEIAFPHVFSYSDRPGVPAARIPDQVPHAVRKARSRELMQAGNAVRDLLLQSRLQQGGHARLLLEQGDKSRPGWLRGRSEDYLPVTIAGEGHVSGDLLTVQYVAVENGTMIAQALADG